MTLLIRWDASDTTYISGPPGERYIHFPLELSTDTATIAGVHVSVTDAAGVLINEQSYDGISLSPGTWSKFSPAMLVADSWFAAGQMFRLKALIYTLDVPISTPKLVTKDISYNPGGIGGTSRNMIIAVIGLGAIYLLAQKKVFR